MYGFEEFIDLTPEQILQKVTQQQIFEFVLKRPFSFNLRYISPFREDKKPNCRFIEREDGTILFVDFGDLTGKTHRTCFAMVDPQLNIAIRTICKHFNLSTDSKDYKSVIVSPYNSTEVDHDFEVRIPFKKVDYSSDDRTYWNQFLISTNELLEDKVYSVSSFRIISDRKNVLITPRRRCYAISFINRVKIYQPQSHEYKWITNCHENNIGNFDNLPASGNTLIIKKSYKDHRVIRNLLPNSNVIWFQNEGCVPDLHILTNLTQRFKHIVIFFDNDDKGIQAAHKLVCIFNSIRQECATMTYLPLRCGHKDPARFVSREGRKDTIKTLKELGL